MPSWTRRALRTCSRTGISPSTERCSTRGRASRASAARTRAPRHRPMIRGIRRSTFTTRPFPREPRIGISGRLMGVVARKGPGREAKLSYAGHVLLDNRHGLVANVGVTAATGTAERDAALLLLDRK